jgi:hypothetical protein
MAGEATTLEAVEELGRQLTGGMLRFDPCHLDVAALESARRVSQRLRGVLDAFDIGLTARGDELSRAGGAADVEKALNPDGQISRGKTKADKTRSEVGAALPGMLGAVRDGELSGEHLDIVARWRNRLSETERPDFDQACANLERDAVGMSLHRFNLHVEHLAETVQAAHGAKLADRQHRARRGREWEDRLSGMRKFLLELDPVGGAAVHDAIHAEVNRLVRERRDNPTDHRTMEQLVADAMTNLILNGQQALRPGSAELLVLVDFHTLVNGLHDQSVHETFDGTHITPDTIRRIACDAHIVPIVLGGPGELLDAGRGQRTATRQQRRALRAIYRTCAIERCTAGYEQCELHHIVPWWNNGLTDLANLVPLCSQHHHMVHEGGHRLTIDASNRVLTIHHPDGRVTIQPPPAGLAHPAAATPSAAAEEAAQPPAEEAARPPGEPTPTAPSRDRQPARRRRPTFRGPESEPPSGDQPPTLFGGQPPPLSRERSPADAA